MKRDIKWYKDALKNAILMEDFEEAKQLRAIIKQMEADK